MEGKQGCYEEARDAPRDFITSNIGEQVSRGLSAEHWETGICERNWRMESPDAPHGLIGMDRRGVYQLWQQAWTTLPSTA